MSCYLEVNYVIVGDIGDMTDGDQLKVYSCMASLERMIARYGKCATVAILAQAAILAVDK